MNQEKIGRFIFEQRKVQGLTQAQLAEKLGVTEKSVGNWENGRNMPDLSLFKSLCDTLGITINDLMSGEIIDDKKYINTLEENIINMVADFNKRRSRIRRISIMVLILMVVGFFGVFLFYMEYEVNVYYDSRVMSCDISEQTLKFNIKGQSLFNTYYTSKDIDGKTVYFFHSTINLYNKRKSNWEYAQSMARLLDNREVPFAYFDKIEVKDHNIEVYYTDSSIRKVKKASDKELKAIIKKGNLVCSS